MGVLIKALEEDQTLFAPLCLDALTARIAEQAGFQLGYVSGGALGYAHAVSEALLSVDELADVVRHVTARSGLEVIVDGGVGFGDAVHMTRAVQVLEAAGAVAIEIEDQVAPKRASHHRGVEHLISAQDMVDKIRVAVDTRRRREFLVVARTGAVKNESYDHACDRAVRYLEAGADAILIMPDEEADWARVRKDVGGPLVTFGALGTRSEESWRALGMNVVIDPFTAQVLAMEAVRDAYQGFMRSGDTGRPAAEVFGLYRQLGDIAGFEQFYEIERDTTEQST